jgi:peptidoglycan/xylan/chitin deacetylase (PgdA/CDA1 family)
VEAEDTVTDVLVLTYHAVSETWPAELSARPADLERQLGTLLDRGYRGATFTEAVTAPPAERTLAVTFDDAYRSVLELAHPILSRLGLPGTVFACTDFVGSPRPMAWPGIDRWLGGPHERELMALTWGELGALADAGWEVGSHTRTHPYLTRLDDSQLDDQLAASKAACEAGLGRPCRSLAYPFGDADARVVDVAAAAGYEAATGPRRRFGSRPELLFPRMAIYHDDDQRRFERKVAPVVRRVWASPAWGLVARLEPLLGR